MEYDLSHNLAECRRQYEAGEITKEDYRWLIGFSPSSSGYLYLVPNGPKGVVHWWKDGRSLCGVVETGGLNMARYTIEEVTFDRPVCRNCRRA
jgi:hypothetical protein